MTRCTSVSPVRIGGTGNRAKWSQSIVRGRLAPPPVKTTKRPPHGAVWFFLAECGFGVRHRNYVKPPFRCFDLLAGAQVNMGSIRAGQKKKLVNRRLDNRGILCRLVCPIN